MDSPDRSELDDRELTAAGQPTKGEPDIALIADAALTALHEHARRLGKVTTRMHSGEYRDELVWLAESMRDEAEKGRASLKATTTKSALARGSQDREV
jgi:hypothetical protein